MPLVAACAGSERNALMDMTCGNMANAAMTATAAARSPQSETAGEPLRGRRPDHAAPESVIGR